MKKRTLRQDAIRRIVRDERVRTQRDLVDRLKAEGFDCTQATVSRDVTEMGLRKLPEGIYVLAEDLHLQRMISELVVSVVGSGSFLLVKSTPGTGPGVAAALDAAEIDGILGSIAGDDTVLVIAKDEKSATRVGDNIDKLRGKDR